MENLSDTTSSVLEELKDVSSTELNDRIVSLPNFYCKKCDELLLPPIRLVDGFGNICGKCELEDSTKNVLRNSSLEEILEQLAIPCPNRLNGCKRHLNYAGVVSHLEICDGRNYHCPYNILSNCSWEGPTSFISGHCYEYHSKYILQSNDTTFNLLINIGSTNNQVRLLNSGSGKFILHTKCDLQFSSVYCILYYTGKINDVEEFMFTVEPIGKDSLTKYTLTYESTKILPFSPNFSLEIDLGNALKMDLFTLEEFIDDSIIEVDLKIKNKNIEVVDETLLSTFKCTNCEAYMRPPIYQCLTGHSLCSNCNSDLRVCSACRGVIRNTRNYLLEALSTKTKFPCLFRELGCHIILTFPAIKEHESECDIQRYVCPFLQVKECFWIGTIATISSHLFNMHANKTKVTNCIERFAISVTNTSDTYCLVYNNDIFKVAYRFSVTMNSICWAVQYVGPKRYAKNYKFEIILSHTRNQRKFVWMDVCCELTNYNNMFKRTIEVPLNQSLLFKNEIAYSCRISKVDKNESDC